MVQVPALGSCTMLQLPRGSVIALVKTPFCMSQGGHIGGRGLARESRESLPGKHEERFVPLDGPAGHSAILVLIPLSPGTAVPVAEEIVGVQDGISEVLPR